RHVSRDMVDPKSLPHLDEQVPVHPPVQFLVEFSDRFERFLPEERSLLQYVVDDVDESPEIEGLGGLETLDPAAVFIDDIALPVHHRALTMEQEMVHGCSHGARQVGVIGVQPRKNVTSGAAKSLVDRVRLATVWLRGPLYPVFVLLQDIERAVSRTSIDD